MKFELKKYYYRISEKELIDDLKRVFKKSDKNLLTRQEYDSFGRYNSITYARKFGSWFNALEKAGLEKPRTEFKISEEELFENLEEIWIKLGRQPKIKEMEKPLSKFHFISYKRRFGTWYNALKKFIEYVNKEKKKIKKEDILPKNLKSKHKTNREVNLRLRFLVMKRDNFRCQNCGKSPAKDGNTILHIDHIIPYSKGGETILENLQTLCQNCNLGKSDYK